jgi:hypothetical protein
MWLQGMKDQVTAEKRCRACRLHTAGVFVMFAVCFIGRNGFGGPDSAEAQNRERVHPAHEKVPAKYKNLPYNRSSRSGLPDPQPKPAIDVILSALEAHAVVALGEDHEIRNDGDFYLVLLRDPRIRNAVDDIYIEQGNAFFQNVIDRYISGEAVSRAELAPVWRDTTHSPFGVGDSPFYEELLLVVRNINEELPTHKRLRVLAADPPIDWAAVKNQSDWMRSMGDREQFAAGLIMRESITKSRKALVIMGSAHFGHKTSQARRLDENVAYWIEKQHPGEVFSVHPLNRQALELSGLDTVTEPWPSPEMILPRGTWVGKVNAPNIFPENYTGDGKGGLWRMYDGENVEDKIDALLFLGGIDKLRPARTIANQDIDYAAEVKRRAQVIGRAP